jgi:hypothetical protein
MVVPVGALIAEVLIADSEGSTRLWSAVPPAASSAISAGSWPVAPNPGQRPVPSGHVSLGTRSHRRRVARRRLRRTPRRGRGDLE